MYVRVSGKIHKVQNFYGCIYATYNPQNKTKMHVVSLSRYIARAHYFFFAQFIPSHFVQYCVFVSSPIQYCAIYIHAARKAVLHWLLWASTIHKKTIAFANQLCKEPNYFWQSSRSSKPTNYIKRKHCKKGTNSSFFDLYFW